MIKKTREVVQAEALQAFKDNRGHGTVCMSTGTGKSKVPLDFIKGNEHIVRVLITSPRDNLKENWRKELIKWGFEEWTDNFWTWNGRRILIIMENVQSTYKWKDISFNIIIADEIHTMMTPEYSKLFENVGFTYLMGLTATHDMTKNNDKYDYYKKYCSVIYEYYESEEDGITNKTRFIIVDHELNNNDKVRVRIAKNTYIKGELQHYEYLTTQIEKGQQFMINQGSRDWFKDAGDWFWKGLGDKEQKFAAMMYLNSIKYRKTFLQNLPSTGKLARLVKNGILKDNEKAKILIFSELTAQVNTITDLTVHSKNHKDVNAQRIVDFNEGKIRELGSCQSLTLGLNLVGATHAVMESYVGSSTRSKQKKGRLDRLATDDVAQMWILRVCNTQAETWFKNMIKNFIDFDKSEVMIINSKSITDGKFNYRDLTVRGETLTTQPEGVNKSN